MGNMPYNFVLALIEKEPVVLAAKPCFGVFVNEFVESFHTPSKDSSTQTDRRLILGLTAIYLNNFWGALMEEVCTQPLVCSLSGTGSPEPSSCHWKAVVLSSILYASDS